MSTEIKLSDLSLDEILKIVEPIMDNCLEGSNEGNYEKHTRDFTERIKSIVTPDELQRQLSNEPKVYFTDREFIRLFRRNNSVGIVWKQLTSLNNDELINQAIFKEIKGNILIDHCMICWIKKRRYAYDLGLIFHFVLVQYQALIYLK